MHTANAWRLFACVILGAGLATAASAADVLIADGKTQPESLGVGPGGVVFAGSSTTPFIYRIRQGATTAEPFVDATADGAGTIFLGILADGATNTVWACQLSPVPNTTPPARRSTLRGFDLASGTQKVRWTLPGDNNVCNDFAVGPDKALYITDTGNGKVFRLRPGAAAADLFVEDTARLVGIDGIAFLNGTMYVNNVRSNKVYRVPVDAGGKPGALVELTLSQPLRGPDGMRAANGRIFVAENGAGRISALAITGDSATVTVIKEGLSTPTAVDPAGDVLWIAERGAGKAVSIPMPK